MKKWISILFLLLVLPSAVLAQEWPVYSAIPRSEAEGTFFDRVDPAWFNPGETTYQNQSRKGRSDCFTYADGAQLLVDEGLKQTEQIIFHPCDNTASLAMSAADFFDVFLPAAGHEPRFVQVHDFME